MKVHFVGNALKGMDLVAEIQEADFWPDLSRAPNKLALQERMGQAVAASDVLSRLKAAFEQFHKEAQRPLAPPAPAPSFWKRPNTLSKADQEVRKKQNKAQKKARRANR